jgi:Kef-type K+ transport system membrane component KefB
MTIEFLLINLCGLVVLSYFFSIISHHIKIPSVLLLLFAGIGFRLIAEAYQIPIFIPTSIVQGLGVIGLIMIVLEAGLDLKITRDKVSLIRSSFFSALIILVVSTVAITFILRFWLQEDITRCIVYALPLSIMSSSITLPSIHPLTERKKEFLVYEASFSDILGILFFNYFTAREILTAKSIGLFGFNIIISVILSLVISFLLFLILTKTRLNVKFFLVFSLLILIYSGGKMLHLPSLLIILVFGIMINNWEQIPLPSLVKRFPQSEVGILRDFLHSITAESSFLVRTFFFILFGFSIDLSFIYNQEVLIIGSLIVIALFLVRWLYLRYFFHTKVFPEAFFIPRGLVTIVLFYKIPGYLKLTTFNDGILFFIVLCTSVILAIGMMFYKKQNDDIVEEPQFLEQKDLL